MAERYLVKVVVASSTLVLYPISECGSMAERAVWGRQVGGSSPPTLTNAYMMQLADIASLNLVKCRFESCYKHQSTVV